MLGKSKFQVSRFLDEKIKRIVKGFCDQDSELAKTDGPLFLLGFNYGNVTNCVAITKNYKLNHSVFPVVGLIFQKQSPSENEIKDIIKTVKQYASPPNGLGSFKTDKNEHLFLIYSYESKIDEVEKRIFNITKGSFVRRKRLRLNVIDDPYYPRQFPRVSEDIFKWDDADSMDGAEDDTIDHLIFFVHGVGGICDVRFRSCIEVVADFKKMANELLVNHTSTTTTRTPTPSSSSNKPLNANNNLKRSFFRKSSSGSSNGSRSTDLTDTSKSTRSNRQQRVECLPVSWHSCTRRQTGLNDQLNLVALNSVPTLRRLLNNVVLDALIYSSGPVYAQTIINNVGDEINRLYSIFLERHPTFNGTISLVGHSLGSVILFDLLANQLSIPGDDSNLNNNNNSISKNNNNDSISSQSDSPSSNDHEPTTSTPPGLSYNLRTPQSQGENHRLSSNQSNNCGIVSHLHNYKNLCDPESNCCNYKNLDELLKDLNLTEFLGIFQREHLDLQSILLLTDLDMKELKLPLGARRKLGNYINFKKVSLVASGMRLQDQQKPNESIRKEKIMVERSLIDNMKTGQYLLKYPQLKFKPKCFFAFGSPLSMFLNIRGIPEIGKNYKLPTCHRVFNIFHPYDPLAYRLEPLIDPRFKDLEPSLVPHHRGGKRIHVQLREGFSKVSTDIRERLLGSIRGTWSSFTRYTQSDHVTSTSTSSSNLKNASSDLDVEIECNSTELSAKVRRQLKRQQSLARSISDHDMIRASSEKRPAMDSTMRQFSHQIDTDSDARILMESMTLTEEENGIDKIEQIIGHPDKFFRRTSSSNGVIIEEPEKEERSKVGTSSTIGELNEGGRIDYVLQEKPIELFNEYLFCFTSHANYWQNEDSALFMLNEIYRGESVVLD